MYSETTAIPVVDSSLAGSTLVHSVAPAVPPSVTEEDVQQSVVSAAAELAPSTSDTSSTASAVTGDKLLAMPPDMTIPIAETVANDTMPNMSENFFRRRLPVPKRQRSATKSGRAHLVSFALTSNAHLDDVEAREAKRSKQKAVPKKMPKLNCPDKAVGCHNKQTKKSPNKVTKKSQNKVKRGAENSKQKNQADRDYCARCKARYGDPADKKSSDDWIACCQCSVYFHESCAEAFGILDDETFTCQTCL